MKKHILILFLALTTTVAYSQTQWKVTSAKITFKIKNAGFTVTGSFGGLVTDIKFDTSNYFKSTIVASVDVNTINTDNSLRDKHLKKEEYFDAPKYPTISLKSSLIAKAGKDNYTGYFTLTIKGVTKDVVIPFSFSESSNSVTFQGEFKLNRRDYTVGGSSLIMSDDVTMMILVNVAK